MHKIEIVLIHHDAVGFSNQGWPTLILNLIPELVCVPFSVLGLYLVAIFLRQSNKTYHRPLSGLHLHNFLLTIWTLMGTRWMQPFVPQVHWNAGTSASCMPVGFVAYGAATGSAVYHASLAAYYLLTICFKLAEHQMIRCECALHALPWLVGCGRPRWDRSRWAITIRLDAIVGSPCRRIVLM